MSKIPSIRLAHELDAAWIIALWKAIHGGDPSPEQIAVEAIAALSLQFSPSHAVPPAGTSLTQLQERLKAIGVEIHEQQGGQGVAAAPAAATAAAIGGQGPQWERTYCVVFQGQRICITLRHPFRWPTP